MAVALARPPDKSRRTLAEALIDHRRTHAAVFARDEELKAALKKLASEEGANFKEDFPGRGSVAVACAKDRTFKGTTPEVVADVFLALPKARQDKLIEQGIVKWVENWSGAFYGSVTVKLF